MHRGMLGSPAQMLDMNEAILGSSRLVNLPAEKSTVALPTYRSVRNNKSLLLSVIDCWTGLFHSKAA